MTRPNEKIRPPTHSSFQKSDPSLRDEAEGDLPDLAKAPDPLAKRGETADDALNANDPQPPHRCSQGGIRARSRPSMRPSSGAR